MELFVSLRYLADYIILDCAAVFEADPASFVGIEIADRVSTAGNGEPQRHFLLSDPHAHAGGQPV